MMESASKSNKKKPTPNDVLLGRASHIYNHPGNIRYRSIISLNQSKYHACQTRLDKMIFIRQITKDILDDGMVTFWKLHKKTDTWTEVDFRTVQDKVSHALRDGKSTNQNPDLIPDYSDETPSRDAPAARPAIKSTLLSQIDHVLSSRARHSAHELQDMRRQHSLNNSLVEDPRDLAFQERQHNLRLASMAAIGGHPQDYAASLGGGYPSQGHRGIRSQSHIFSPSSLLHQEASARRASDSLIHDGLINQSNTLSQQLSPDDLLLHAMRQQRSLSATGPSAAAPYGEHSSFGTAPYQNQRIYGTHLPRKNLQSPAYDGGGSTSLREQSLIDTLQKLKSQRVAEIQALEQQLRNVQH